MRTWFYYDGSRVGPLAESVVADMAAAGLLHAGSLVWSEGFEDWKLLGEVGTFAPPPAPPDYEPPRAAARLVVPARGWTRAARWLGLLSVLVIPAPLAVVAGVRALREGHRSGASDRRWAIFGIVMGAVFSAVLVWLIVAAALG